MWFKLGTINNLKLLSYLTVRVFNVLKGTLVSFNIGKIFLKCSWNKIFLLVCHKISMIFQKEIIIFDMKERSEFGCVFQKSGSGGRLGLCRVIVTNQAVHFHPKSSQSTGKPSIN
jgi:hypothetical protein